MSDDEDIEVCDICEEILLSSKALAKHIKEQHGPPKKVERGGNEDDAKKEKKKPKMGPASQVKRALSSSTEDVSSKPELASKKPQMGPKSKVRRERSGSPIEDASKTFCKHYFFHHEKNKKLTIQTPIKIKIKKVMKKFAIEHGDDYRDLEFLTAGSTGPSCLLTGDELAGEVPRGEIRVRRKRFVEAEDVNSNIYIGIAHIGMKTDSNSEKIREKHREHKLKKEKKHKHNKEHKQKHKKDKKHKEGKHREREANHLGYLLKELTLDSNSRDNLKAKVDGASRSWVTDPSVQLDPVTEAEHEAGHRIAHQPRPPRSPSEEKDIKFPGGSSEADQQPHQEDPEDEESDDELGDLPVSVFG